MACEKGKWSSLDSCRDEDCWMCASCRIGIQVLYWEVDWVLLRLTSRKPLWLDLQPVDIKSLWRHNWKSAQVVVNSHPVCDPTIRQPVFDLPRQQWSLLNCFRMERTLRCLQKEMATYRHWSVCLWRDSDDVSHCRILSPDKTEWRLILATLCGWRLFRGWPVMVHDMHTRRRRLGLEEDIVFMLRRNRLKWHGYVLRKDEGDW